MFKIGDRVKLQGCPIASPAPDEKLMYNFIMLQTLTVTDVQEVKETSTQLIKTDLTLDWLDSIWFKTL